MSTTSNVATPELPPLAVMARAGLDLHVTVLHDAAADLFWQHRKSLTQIYGCTGMRLSVICHGRIATLVHWRPTARRVKLRRQ